MVKETAAHRIRDRSQVTRKLQARQKAHCAVAEIGRAVAGLQEHLAADRNRERSAVFAEKAKIGGEAQVANARMRRRGRVGDPTEGHVLTVLPRGNGKVDRQTKPIAGYEADARVHDELIAQNRDRRPVRIVEDERTIGVVGHQAEGRARRTTQVQRVGGEPVASSFSRVEPTDGEAARCRLGSTVQGN